ncbi:MAG: glycosyltransferase family 4 protein [Streptosporangiaceae bacterium]
MTQARVRALLLIDHPAQHFTCGLQTLAHESSVDVRVLYRTIPDRSYDAGFGRVVSWDLDLLGGYRWAAPPAASSALSRLRWLGRQVRELRPDVVVCYGWASPITRAFFLMGPVTSARVLLYGDTTWQHSSGQARKDAVRSIALRTLMSRCAGAVSTGTFNREFYISHGMPPQHIWPGVCPADTELFGQARQDHPSAGQTGTPPRIGFAGKLIPRKGVDELVRAASLLPREPEWSLTVVGDGPLRASLEALAAESGVAGRIHFHGFANASEMPKLLAGFAIVVVPSRLDMRALVTIEAMAAGAAVVVSDATAVWGNGDLIEPGVTGLVYESGDPAALAAQLSQLLTRPALLASVRAMGVKRSADFGAAAFARSMATAIRESAEGKTALSAMRAEGTIGGPEDDGQR